MKEAIYISDLHFEHSSWNNDLAFQRDELTIFEKRLEEVAPRYTRVEVLSKVEQFQNKFIRHFEVIDTLQHKIKVHENHLSVFATSHPIAVDHVRFNDHGSFRGEIETQIEMYKDLKKDFLRFLTQTM